MITWRQKIDEVLKFAEDMLTDGVMNLTMRMLPMIRNVTKKVAKVVDPLITVFDVVDNMTDTALVVVDKASNAAALVKNGAQGLSSVADNLVELIETGDTSLIGDIFQGVAQVIEDATADSAANSTGASLFEFAETMKTMVRGLRVDTASRDTQVTSACVWRFTRLAGPDDGATHFQGPRGDRRNQLGCTRTSRS